MNKKNAFYSLLALFFSFSCQQAKTPVDYVNPYIGNISHLLVPTFATVQLPNSMLRIYPERADYTSEYMNGLPLVVTNHRERSAFKLSVTADEVTSPVLPLTYDNEHLTPYLWEVSVADGSIDVRFAPSHQSALYELRSDRPLSLSIASLNGEVHMDGNTLKGIQHIDDKTSVFLCMESQEEPKTLRMAQDGDTSFAIWGFDSPVVHLRYGVSYISAEQAEANLRRELNHYNVDAQARQGRDLWNKTLSRIAVQGGSEDDKTVFYTSYYRTFERPVCISEDGRYWSAEDGTVHEDGGIPFYTDDWLWDTYRAAHPLRLLTDSHTEEAILTSFIRMARENGKDWMPTFPEISGDTRRMNSNHTVATFADAAVKGLDFDRKAALEVAYKGITEKTLAPWSAAPAGLIDRFYWENGYIPALREGEAETDPNVHSFEKRQPVAVTLGTAYDCWCLAQLAAQAGDDSLSTRFLALSQRYRTLFNPETRFFHPKDKDGNWIPNMDYTFPGGLGAREFYDENNAWVYRWDVQHDIAGLIQLMGGREAFITELDRMFATPLGHSKFEFYSKLPDHTGNVGQFSMANEPSLHVPYLYNYAGAPWKTQKRIRQMLRTWFRNDLMGIPGDEDGGGMTSFVVFSSVGLYPVTPGLAEYTIGSPLFEKSVIHLSNGKTFTVKAKGVSADAKYIQRATLNGKEWNSPFLPHEALVSGGELCLEMGAKPNPDWGTNL